MTRDRELLERLQSALADADLDAEALVADAWDEARTEVQQTLRRLMTRELLERALASIAPDTGAAHLDAEAAPAGEEDATAPDAALGTQRAPAPGTTVTYLFGITDDAGELGPPDPRRLPGGGAPRWVVGAGVRALVCDVDPATFEVLRSPGPEGLDTLAAAAHAHDEVLAHLAAATTVLPLRLGTVVPDDEALRALLAEHADELSAELGRMEGMAEWSVTVQLFDEAEPGDEAARAASSGADYLQRRRDALDAREHRWERRQALAAALHERLASCARQADTVTSRPVDDVAPPLLHGVYLVSADEVADLEEVVARLRAEHPGTVIEITGPWPPYHFTSVGLALGEDMAP
jgi:hypothetical protein